MPPSALVWAMGPALQAQPPRQAAWGAVLLVCVSTLVGAYLARRDSERMTLWLAVASAMMLVTALVDLLPDAWGEAAETGVPLWGLALAALFGFLVITYFTRRGCACPEDAAARTALHGPGLHRRIKQGMDAAVFGGMGTAAALTLHRAIEGAALALTASVVVIIALVVHSASEGLALAALLDIAKQRLTPWLIVSCLSPAAGVVVATISPLPAALVPILLSMVMGVLCRTAIVGMKLAAGKQRSGRLSRRQIAVAAAAAACAGVLLVTANVLGGGDGPAKASHPAPTAAPPAGLPRPGPDATLPAPAQAPPPHGPAPTVPLSRAQLREELTAGRLGLAEVFRRDDEITRRTPIRRILLALPGATPVTVHTLLMSTGLDGRQWVADLTERQRRALLAALARRRDPPPAPEG
ncbi:hypothetical protein AB0D67_09385 [Streptosporangium sp. NPDC048047]|uniref:hypothetical protein n=1 Tax=Streptosporangium sp. NPDC048047 TaxID=3155748 RepID=UPI0034304B61